MPGALELGVGRRHEPLEVVELRQAPERVRQHAQLRLVAREDGVAPLELHLWPLRQLSIMDANITTAQHNGCKDYDSSA